MGTHAGCHDSLSESRLYPAVERCSVSVGLGCSLDIAWPCRAFLLTETSAALQPALTARATEQAGPTREGNFANPESSVGNDPRIDPAFLAHIMTAPEPVANMLAAKNTENPLEAAATQAQRMEVSMAVEQGYVGAVGFLISEVPMDGLVETTETIEGVDGNKITLYITKPVGDGPFPVVVHLHGGGMAILTAAGKSA